MHTHASKNVHTTVIRMHTYPSINVNHLYWTPAVRVPSSCQNRFISTDYLDFNHNQCCFLQQFSESHELDGPKMND